MALIRIPCMARSNLWGLEHQDIFMYGDTLTIFMTITYIFVLFLLYLKLHESTFGHLGDE